MNFLSKAIDLEFQGSSTVRYRLWKRFTNWYFFVKQPIFKSNSGLKSKTLNFTFSPALVLHISMPWDDFLTFATKFLIILFHESLIYLFIWEDQHNRFSLIALYFCLQTFVWAVNLFKKNCTRTAYRKYCLSFPLIVLVFGVKIFEH